MKLYRREGGSEKKILVRGVAWFPLWKLSRLILARLVCVIDFDGGSKTLSNLCALRTVVQMPSVSWEFIVFQGSADAFNLNHTNRTHDKILSTPVNCETRKAPRERKKCYSILDLINEHLSFTIGFWLQLPVLEGDFRFVFSSSSEWDCWSRGFHSV